MGRLIGIQDWESESYFWLRSGNLQPIHDKFGQLGDIRGIAKVRSHITLTNQRGQILKIYECSRSMEKQAASQNTSIGCNLSIQRLHHKKKSLNVQIYQFFF